MEPSHAAVIIAGMPYLSLAYAFGRYAAKYAALRGRSKNLLIHLGRRVLSLDPLGLRPEDHANRAAPASVSVT